MGSAGATPTSARPRGIVHENWWARETGSRGAGANAGAAAGTVLALEAAGCRGAATVSIVAGHSGANAGAGLETLRTMAADGWIGAAPAIVPSTTTSGCAAGENSTAMANAR